VFSRRSVVSVILYMLPVAVAAGVIVDSTPALACPPHTPPACATYTKIPLEYYHPGSSIAVTTVTTTYAAPGVYPNCAQPTAQLLGTAEPKRESVGAEHLYQEATR